MKNIEEKLKCLPNESGVYVMKSADDTVIYVGKAKNLKTRVSQYFRSGIKDRKVEAMVERISNFDYIITPSETEALALENNLIKKYHPFYNILLKDSKTFPYIKVNLSESFPKFEVTRRVKKDGAKYFGPYIGVSAHEIVKILNECLGLRDCGSSLFNSAKQVRECLNYSLGLCSAPCTGRVTKEVYGERVARALEFLKGNTKNLESLIYEKMNLSANSMNFENALVFRNKLTSIQNLNKKTIANMPKSISRDAVFCLSDGFSAVISVVILRVGCIMGVNNFSLPHVSLTPGEMLFSFLSQYYKDKMVPDGIILSHSIETPELLEEYFEKTINFITSPIGTNLKLLNMAKRNAEEHLKLAITKDEAHYNNTVGALVRLKERLGLLKLPNRIECYDISHTSGTNKMASMVVFVAGEAKRSHYRKFKIVTVKGSDDFASLKETLSRRLIRLSRGEGESFKECPDLLVIDGGKGQLSSVMEVLCETDFKDVEIISLAKRIEEVFKPNNSRPILLTPGSAELKLLQRIRDEAHRFAIAAHRHMRGRSMTSSELDGIKGLGKIKKAALFRTFKTIENISAAGVAELNSIKGIDPTLAKKIFDYLHEGEKKAEN